MVECKCPNCNMIGSREKIGEYTSNDDTFQCKFCGYNKKNDFTNC